LVSDAPVAAAGVITVMEVRVVKLPSGRVLVLSKVEVVNLVCEECSLDSEVDSRLEVELVAVDRVEGTEVVW
jgi:hypothetical protein